MSNRMTHNEINIEQEVFNQLDIELIAEVEGKLHLAAADTRAETFNPSPFDLYSFEERGRYVVYE